jgi:methyl-accepting chemotaxis protein
MVAEEINRNLFEIKSVVDSTAAGVSQTAARCGDLESVANNLKMKISQFKF